MNKKFLKIYKISKIQLVYFIVQIINKNLPYLNDKIYKIKFDKNIKQNNIWIYYYIFYFMFEYYQNVEDIENDINNLFLFLIICWILLKGKVEDEYRNYKVTNLNSRLLKYFQKNDNGYNSIPSFHVILSSLISSKLIKNKKYIRGISFFLLVPYSTVKIKQHYILDSLLSMIIVGIYLNKSSKN